jgi:hypothetical protein
VNQGRLFPQPGQLGGSGNASIVQIQGGSHLH